MPSLIVTSGVLAGQVFSFSDTAVIGRGQFSEVRLNDPTVSRHHLDGCLSHTRRRMRQSVFIGGVCFGV